MANISSYPNKTPKLSDIIMFSETYDVSAASPVVGNPTKSTSVSGIGAAISPTIATGTINTIAMFTTANKIGDSPIVFNGSSSTTVTGDLTASNDLIAGRDLTVTRTTSISGLITTGAAVFGANATFDNDLTVDGVLNATGGTNIIVSEYSDNADALANGLTVGAIYRTGDLLKIVR
tara:strand:+ start:23 stop:553 length:531 start_codon:yes stop_codon:yes gene_type:complete